MESFGSTAAPGDGERGARCAWASTRIPPAGRLGPARRRGGPGTVQPRRWSRRSPTGSRWSSRSRRFSSDSGHMASRVLESTIRQLREAGALVLLDVKRGDIGSTVAAYADAYLDPSSPLCADAITASPYLGRRLAAPDVRHGGRARRRRVRAGAHLQPRGTGRAARRDGRRPDRRADRHRRDFPAQRGCGAAREHRCWWSARPSARPVTTCPGSNGPILAPGLGAQGGDARRSARGLRRRLDACCRRTPGRSSARARRGRAARRRGPRAADAVGPPWRLTTACLRVVTAE